jgi:hypothetical protein
MFGGLMSIAEEENERELETVVPEEGVMRGGEIDHGDGTRNAREGTCGEIETGLRLVLLLL